MRNAKHPSNSNLLHLRTAMLMIAAVLAAGLCSAATNNWTGTAGDMKWSTSGNWSATAAPTNTDDVVFNVDGAGSTAGVVDNIVDGSFAIQSLSYCNTNTFHTTQIDPSATLVVTGSVATAAAGRYRHG